MAYMSQENKAQMAPAIKAVLKKYGMKGSLGVGHHSTLVCNIKSGPLDIIGDYNAVVKEWAALHNEQVRAPATDIQVNGYNIANQYTGKVKNFLTELHAAMNVGNYDRSDIQSDYFCVGWYVYINVGKWDKPYVLVK